jgi:hypothetical protein
LDGKDGKTTKKWLHKEKVLRKRNKVILEQYIALLFAAAYNVPFVLRNERITYVPKRIQLKYSISYEIKYYENQHR